MAITVGVVMKVVTSAISTRMANISSFSTCANVTASKFDHSLLLLSFDSNKKGCDARRGSVVLHVSQAEVR
jgi:hypothetical protein